MKIFCSASSPNLPTAPLASCESSSLAPPPPEHPSDPTHRSPPSPSDPARRSPPSPVGLPSPPSVARWSRLQIPSAPLPWAPRSSRSGRRPAPARPSAAGGRAPLEAAAASGPALAPTVSTCIFPTVISSSRDSKHAGACFGNRGRVSQLVVCWFEAAARPCCKAKSYNVGHEYFSGPVSPLRDIRGHK